MIESHKITIIDLYSTQDLKNSPVHSMSRPRQFMFHNI